MGTLSNLNPLKRYKRKRTFGMLARIGIGFVAGVAAAAVIYEIAKERHEEKKLAMPGMSKGKIVRFPAERPPYAEAAESSAE